MTANAFHETRLLEEARSTEERQRVLASLYSAHPSRLRSMVQVSLDPRLHARLDPSDVLQDVYVEATRRFDGYVRHPTLPFFLWLRSLAEQRLVDLHRRHLWAKGRDARKERRLPGTAPASSILLAEHFVHSGPSPSDEAMRAEARARVQAALDQLDATDREFLSLRHFEELTALETAQVLGIKESASKMRYVRAMERVRKVLFARPDEEDSR